MELKGIIHYREDDDEYIKDCLSVELYEVEPGGHFSHSTSNRIAIFRGGIDGGLEQYKSFIEGIQYASKGPVHLEEEKVNDGVTFKQL